MLKQWTNQFPKLLFFPSTCKLVVWKLTRKQNWSWKERKPVPGFFCSLVFRMTTEMLGTCQTVTDKDRWSPASQGRSPWYLPLGFLNFVSADILFQIILFVVMSCAFQGWLATSLILPTSFQQYLQFMIKNMSPDFDKRSKRSKSHCWVWKPWPRSLLGLMVCN